MSQYVVFNPQLADGKPFFKGTDIRVSEVLEQLASGQSREALLKTWPGRLTAEAIAEAVRLAAQALAAHAPDYVTQDEAGGGAPPAGGSLRGVSGQLVLCLPDKKNYGMGERICFRETLRNQTAAPITYSFLGLSIVNRADGTKRFHTSWSGDLTLPANGIGPTPEGWEDGCMVEAPGTYRITLDMCFASKAEGERGIGWETLTPGIDVVVAEVAVASPPPTSSGAYVSRGIQGSAFSVEKTEVRVKEDLWFNFKVTNTSDQPVRYGVLAARTESGQAAQSWSNETLAPRQVLEWRDHINLQAPGAYKLFLGICYGDSNECMAMRAPWDRLSESITVVGR